MPPPPPPPPPPQSDSWMQEPLLSPQCPFYPPGLPSQTSAESNPYISLDSPTLSPPSPPEYPPSPPIRKKRYTFSRPPRTSDTDLFMEALSEQLGQQLSVDDFLSPENDYEEVCILEWLIYLICDTGSMANLHWSIAKTQCFLYILLQNNTRILSRWHSRIRKRRKRWKRRRRRRRRRKKSTCLPS